jgi:TolB-like protein/tetratricopeptide (TPR) repeat protein
VTESRPAVFLSYASEDTDAARRICETLRCAHIEVWFDQSELRGGDAWDTAIRKQIKACALFIPLISSNSQARAEGYFRLEWKLAVDRSHLIAADKPFLFPVVIDGTKDEDARVPDGFREVQWTRLPEGETSPAFVQRITGLLSPGGQSGPATNRSPVVEAPYTSDSKQTFRHLRTSWRTSAALLAIAAMIAIALVYLLVDHFARPKRAADAPPTTILPSGDVPPSATPAPFTPPAHSVAVLPFTNMSGDASQEYFSDGLSEELLDSLAHVDVLRVPARTSSFSFKGKDVDIATVARRLNVGAVLEGSVRRGDHRVRVTAQLIDAVTGFHLWSQTYDEGLTDVLTVQKNIALAVAGQLNVTLSGNALAKIGQGTTLNPKAFDAYLMGVQVMARARNDANWRTAIAFFDKAIAFDPRYAAAYALRAGALIDVSTDTVDPRALADLREQARRSADAAVRLAPDFAEAYAARGFVRAIGLLDFGGAGPDFERAVKMAPGSALTQKGYAGYSSIVGHQQAALTASKRAVELDPENYSALTDHILMLEGARRYSEALQAVEEAKKINPSDAWQGTIGAIFLATGRPELARDTCVATLAGPDPAFICLAIAYHMLGNQAEAEKMLHSKLAKEGDAGAYEYAETYAQWGNVRESLKWLGIVARVRSPSIQRLRTDWMLDPLRAEPEYKAIERQFNFPP